MDANRMYTMKDMNEILASGILQQYLLGELEVSDHKKVEGWMETYPDLRSHYQQMEEDLMQVAMENAITPPSQLKDSLLNQITKETQTQEKPVVPISRGRRNSYLPLVASLAALFLLSSIWLYNKVNSLEESVEVVTEENSTLKTNLEQLNTQFAETDRWYQAISNPDTQPWVILGNDNSPAAKAVSYVNHQDKTVILNTAGLPELDSEHDYQMWADVEGEMINMGVIPKDEAMVAMTYIDDAESLNITIEPAGGNDHPTVERLIGNVYIE